MTSFSGLVSKLKDSDSYWQQAAKLDFALGLHHLMEENELSRADLARKIKKSDAYVTKVLRGDSNFTIDTMVSLVRALDGALHIKVCDRTKEAKFVTWAVVEPAPSRHDWNFGGVKLVATKNKAGAEQAHEKVRAAA